jgi:hypothetical protein
MSTFGSHYQATASENCNRLRKPNVSYSDLWSVVMNYECAVNPITSPNPIHSELSHMTVQILYEI